MSAQTSLTLHEPKRPCVDCGQRVGIIPAVVDSPSGRVHRICVLCHNKWRPFLHQAPCTCPHCAYWNGVLAKVPVTQ